MATITIHRTPPAPYRFAGNDPVGARHVVVCAVPCPVCDGEERPPEVYGAPVGRLAQVGGYVSRLVRRGADERVAATAAAPASPAA